MEIHILGAYLCCAWFNSQDFLGRMMTRRQLLKQTALAGGVWLFPEALGDFLETSKEAGSPAYTFFLWSWSSGG